MVTYGGLIGVLAASLLLMAGLLGNQGWLAFLSMIVIALMVVGGVFWLPARRPLAPAERSATARRRVSPPSPAEAGFLLLVLLTAALLSIGILFDMGWLAFLSMIAVGLSVVVGLAKLSRPTTH